MSFTVFLGNLPLWVTADDIKSWLAAENLVADNVKVIRNPETQESKGFAFIEAPNQEEMNSIIRRFDRAPLEDRLLRANPAQPPKGKGEIKPGAGPMRSGSGFGDRRPAGAPRGASAGGTSSATGANAGGGAAAPPADGSTAAGPTAAGVAAAGAARSDKRRRPSGPPSAFAEELAKAL